MAEWVITVAQLNEYVRKKLAGDSVLQKLTVKGEISDLKAHYASGHLYFTLKDEHARISCVMYRSNAAALKMAPANGQKVIVSGQAGLYPVSGQYQLYIESMKAEGSGSIYERYEELKRKLAAEGLFDNSHKKPIPCCVRTIGVATSGSGAAIRDIIRVARHRNPRVNIIVAPCRVQGAGAENEIAASIDLLDKSGKCDVILVGRGGGSIEDLWPFNEEVTARAVYNCVTPIVSCVGHETDFTITDFAADIRAATPSNGAEIAVNEVSKQLDRLESLSKRLTVAIKNGQIHRYMRLDLAMRSECFRNPRQFLTAARSEKLKSLYERLTAAEKRKTEDLAAKLENTCRLLESLNPDSIKKRGYACVRRKNSLITTVNGVSVNDEISIELSDGRIEAAVTGITE